MDACGKLSAYSSRGPAMLRYWPCLVVLSASAGHAEVGSLPVTSPHEAIAMAEASEAGRAGRFEMDVVATGRVGGAVFLNSSSDYRAPDDVSFRLSPNVVKELTRRFGEPPELFLKSKHVVVDGTVKRELIVNKSPYFDQAISPNRWQHIVRVMFARQLVSITER